MKQIITLALFLGLFACESKEEKQEKQENKILVDKIYNIYNHKDAKELLKISDAKISEEAIRIEINHKSDSAFKYLDKIALLLNKGRLIKTLHPSINDYTCEDLIHWRFDKIEADSSLYSHFSLNKDFSLMLFYGKKHKTTDIAFDVEKGCIKEGDKATILFRDKTKKIFKHASDVNCEGNFYAFRQSPQEFQEKSIETIRIETSERNKDFEFTKEDSEYLIKCARCFFEAKK